MNPPSESALPESPASASSPGQPSAALRDRGATKSLDTGMLAGVAIAIAGTVVGIRSAGVSLTYFFQSASAFIVLGGTFGISLIATPTTTLRQTARRILKLHRPEFVDRESLIEELVSYAKVVRVKGLVSIDQIIENTSHAFLRDIIKLALDIESREELRMVLETKIRMRERQGEKDAKVLEVAGGFAPTIGVLGTVVGLIEILRQFSNVSAVALGVGTAFVSTFYGLALANLVLLPAAHRIRANLAETFELEEMMIEGAICLFDEIHHSLVREHLSNFLRAGTGR
jgi:chemotaxis protein MotA